MSPPIRPIFIGRINIIGVATLYRREVQRFMTVALQTLAAPVIPSVLFLLVFSVAIGNRSNLAGDVDFVVFLVPTPSGEPENPKIMCRNEQSILSSKFMRKTSPEGTVRSEQGTGILNYFELF